MHDNKEDISFKQFVDAIHQQAQAALDDPYVFKRPIKNVAVIGAGAHGVSHSQIFVFFSSSNNSSFVFIISSFVVLVI
jgi:hypothetical protein